MIRTLRDLESWSLINEEKFSFEKLVPFILLVIITIIDCVVLYILDERVSLFLWLVSSWLVSLCIHEFGHALAAYYGGDHSVKRNGYLWLNPFKYTSIVQSIVIPIGVMILSGGFSLPGGMVTVETSSLKSRKWETIVALAGPLGTMICYLLCLILFISSNFFIGYTYEHNLYLYGLAAAAYIQLNALFFNLVPVPPFDGFHAIFPYLPTDFKEWYSEFRNKILSDVTGLLFALLSWRFTPIQDFILKINEFCGVSSFKVMIGLDLGLPF